MPDPYAEFQKPAVDPYAEFSGKPRSKEDVDRIMREKTPQAYEKPNAPQSWGEVFSTDDPLGTAMEFGKGAMVDTAKGIYGALRHPIDTARGMADAQVDQFYKAAGAEKDPNKPGRLRAVSNPGTASERAGHLAAGIIPGAGPAAAGIGETIGSGEVARGIGQGVALATALSPENIQQPVVNAVKPVARVAKAAVKAGAPSIARGAIKAGTGALVDYAIPGASSHIGTAMGAVSGASDIVNGIKDAYRGGRAAITPEVMPPPEVPVQAAPPVSASPNTVPSSPMPPPTAGTTAMGEAIPGVDPFKNFKSPAMEPPPIAAPMPPKPQALPSIQQPIQQNLPSIQAPQPGIMEPPPMSSRFVIQEDGMPLMKRGTAPPGEVEVPTAMEAKPAVMPPPGETLYPTSEGGVPAQTMPREHYIKGAQTLKARALARMMKIEKVPLEDALIMTPEQWEMVAKAAGVNKPSAATIARAIEEMKAAQ